MTCAWACASPTCLPSSITFDAGRGAEGRYVREAELPQISELLDDRLGSTGIAPHLGKDVADLLFGLSGRQSELRDTRRPDRPTGGAHHFASDGIKRCRNPQRPHGAALKRWISACLSCSAAVSPPRSAPASIASWMDLKTRRVPLPVTGAPTPLASRASGSLR